MSELYDSIRATANNSGQAASIIKHLGAVDIASWDDITRSKLYDLRDHLRETVSPNTAKTVAASFKAILRRFSDDISLPRDYADILLVKGERPMKTFLTPDDIEAIEGTPTHTDIEKYVKACFLVSCWTGMRVSDAEGITSENVDDGYLTYVSKKTGVAATVPVKPGLMGYIRTIQRSKVHPTVMGYNKAIRRIAERAGLTEPVKIHKGGKTMTARKCDCISSHTGRISIATNLAKMGATLTDIRLTLGHTNELMTSRYIVSSRPELSQSALSFFE